MRSRGVVKLPRKDLEVDPETKRQIIIKDGRFGIYVVNGKTNGTLRRGDTIKAMTNEQSQDLLAGREPGNLRMVTPQRRRVCGRERPQPLPKRRLAMPEGSEKPSAARRGSHKTQHKSFADILCQRGKK